jgi:hypothetical protein
MDEHIRSFSESPHFLIALDDPLSGRAPVAADHSRIERGNRIRGRLKAWSSGDRRRRATKLARQAARFHHLRTGLRKGESQFARLLQHLFMRPAKKALQYPRQSRRAWRKLSSRQSPSPTTADGYLGHDLSLSPNIGTSP